MAIGVIVFAAWLAFMALTVAAFVVWAYKEDQLKDIEEPKYRMLEEREPEPWPGREKARPLKANKRKLADQPKRRG